MSGSVNPCSTRPQADPREEPGRMTRILYVDASELLNRRLTGIQRYTVRVIHRLAQMTPIRLVTPLPWSLAALRIGRPTRLVAGQEIELNPDNVPPSDLDAK